MRDYEYRMLETVKPSKQFKVGLFASGTDSLIKTYDGYLGGKEYDVMTLYPASDGLGAYDVGVIPGKHKVSIFLIKEK